MAKIRYTSLLEGITAQDLNGFFRGWPNPPDEQTYLALLKGSNKVLVAVDTQSNQVVGFITAITDGILTAFIPLLEVLPAYQDRGIGAELIRRMLEQLSRFYAIYLHCDPGLQRYYERFGMKPSGGMSIRNYANLSGKQL